MEHRVSNRVTRVAGLLMLAVLFAGCAVNPATGKRQLMLVSESQERAMGAEADPQVLAQFGVYPDDELQRYVNDIGQRMAAKSERPDLDWHFKVVDDPLVNAFALPGGYIYVTRGILAHFNSEAELASVLGHEIGHVTARHGANQMSKAQLAQVGMVAGAIAAKDYASDFLGLAQTGLGLLFLKYGRDDERQADDLGLRYVVDTGYDPHPMTDMFVTLQRVSAAAGGQAVPGWMSTHPAPENREARIDAQIAKLGPDFSGGERRRDEYLARIDSAVFGDDPRQGYFHENIFIHPEMAFRLTFPKDWKTVNTRQAVGAGSGAGDAVIQLTLADKPTADEARAAFFNNEGISSSNDWTRSLNGRNAFGAEFTATQQQGAVRGAAMWVEHRDLVFQLLGYTSETKWSGYRATVNETLRSFGPVRDNRLLDVSPHRLKIVRLDRAMDLESFAKRYDATVDAATLAVINGVDPSSRLQAGRSYKVVTGGRVP